MDRIAYQGVKGSFSYLTAKRLFEGAEIKGFRTFKEAYSAAVKGEADYALLPIENTLTEALTGTIDLIIQGDLKIVGSTKTQVEHALLALPGVKLNEIKQVLSHPIALAQCTQFLNEHPFLEAVNFYDTAGAAEEVANQNDRTTSAIANREAGKIYGLEVIVDSIQDHVENFTRFVLLSKREIEGKNCALVFVTEHKPGALAEVLNFLAKNEMNLTQIVSRPIVGKPFEYQFYIEIENAKPALKDLKVHSLKILGCYDNI